MKASEESSRPDEPVDEAIKLLSQAARLAAQRSGDSDGESVSARERDDGAGDGKDAGTGDARSARRWERLHREWIRRRRARRVGVAAVTFAGIAAVVAIAVGRAPAIQYQVEGHVAVGEGGYLHDVASGGAHLRFSDGTRVDLDAGARGWVVSRGPHGARLRLEGGHAHFAVVHRARSNWTVDAGPYAIAVTGTDFDVRWSGADEQLEVALNRGEVIVRGPLADGAVVLQPGQRLTAHARSREMRIDAPPVASAAASASVEPSDAPVAPRLPSVVTAPARPRPHVARGSRLALAESSSSARPAPGDWGRLVAAGDFAGVLDQAERYGIETCASGCPIEALAALADAARYLSKGDLARRILLVERQRFPGSSPARAAAFLLARLADDGGQGTRAAIDWYDHYLTESPDGAYAEEALGRKMLAVEKLPDRAGARRVATEYLRRFPGGGYLPQATALMKHP